MKNYGITPYMNFDCFISLLNQKRRLIRTHYYNIPLKQSDDPDKYAAQQKFFTRLRKIPRFSLHFGRQVKRVHIELCPHCKESIDLSTYTEKGVDVDLATDMLANAFDDTYDTAILVSGDGDYVPAVREVITLGKIVENHFFQRESPSFLSGECSKFIPLNEKKLRPCLLPKT